jgi:hypothetical protein
MTWEPNADRKAKVAAILSVAKAMHPGQVMTFADLSGRVGFPVADASDTFYQGAIAKAEKEIERTIVTQRGEGTFRIATPDDGPALHDSRMRRVRGQGRKSAVMAQTMLRQTNDTSLLHRLSNCLAVATIAAGIGKAIRVERPSDKI